MASEITLQPLEFCNPVVLRRLALGAGLAVSLLLLGTTLHLWLDDETGSREERRVVLGIFACADVWMWFLVALAARWRIRVDDRGVARRHLIDWELWPWDAFQSGQIEQVVGDRFAYQWRWTRSPLVFGHLEKSERELLDKTIQGRWLPAVETELPTELTIWYEPSRLRLGPRRRIVRFRADGLWLEHRRHQRGFSWNEISRVRMLCPTANRRDFTRLELRLSDSETLALWITGKNPQDRRYAEKNWTGAPSKSIARFLERRLPANRVRINTFEEPFEDVEEVERTIGNVTSADAKARRILDLIFLVLLCVNLGIFLIFFSIVTVLSLNLPWMENARFVIDFVSQNDLWVSYPYYFGVLVFWCLASKVQRSLLGRVRKNLDVWRARVLERQEEAYSACGG